MVYGISFFVLGVQATKRNGPSNSITTEKKLVEFTILVYLTIFFCVSIIPCLLFYSSHAINFVSSFHKTKIMTFRIIHIQPQIAMREKRHTRTKQNKNNPFTLSNSRKYGLHADRTTRCAFKLRPSQANVTSTKSSSSRKFSNADVMLLW